MGRQKNNWEKEAKRRARELRRKFQQRGEFTHDEYLAELAPELADLKAKLLDSAITKIAGDIDQEFKEKAPDRSHTLGGIDWDAKGEGELRLGGGKRISKHLARIEHVDLSLALKQRNAAAVNIVLAEDLEVIARLRPYFGSGATWPEAVAAYRKDHPDD